MKYPQAALALQQVNTEQDDKEAFSLADMDFDELEPFEGPLI